MLSTSASVSSGTATRLPVTYRINTSWRSRIGGACEQALSRQPRQACHPLSGAVPTTLAVIFNRTANPLKMTVGM
jgi:hypothetical protein